jgi:hypothetical protein
MLRQQIVAVLGALVVVWMLWGLRGPAAAAAGTGPESMPVGQKLPITSKILEESAMSRSGFRTITGGPRERAYNPPPRSAPDGSAAGH